VIGRLFHAAGIFFIVAASPPSLDQTELFTSRTHDCRPQNLTTWSHPAKQVLQKNAVGLDAVQLCNEGKYPIFTVKFPYDPRARTTDWFHRLYARMAQANGFWSFSFVDVVDNVIVNVTVDKTHQINVGYEEYQPEGKGDPATQNGR
jgi:hypothetical protein